MMKIPNKIPNKEPTYKQSETKSSKLDLKFIGSILLLISCFGIMIWYFMFYNTSKPKQVLSEVKSEKTSSKSSSVTRKDNKNSVKPKESSKAESKVENPIVQKLTEQAKDTKQPFKIATKDIGGGYIFGIITYFPDDADKTYMDYSITAPENATEPTKDEKTEEIENKLKESLPTINKSIEVDDTSKVSMLTYKQDDDSYHTILLYEGTPFGYVLTDKDGHMTNNVTTYYIQHVKKK